MTSTRWRGNWPARGVRARRAGLRAPPPRASPASAPPANSGNGSRTPAECRAKLRARRGPREAAARGVRACTLRAAADRERSMAKQVGPALAAPCLPEPPRPLRGETDRLRGGEAEDAVVREGVGVGAERVPAYRHHQILG